MFEVFSVKITGNSKSCSERLFFEFVTNLTFERHSWAFQNDSNFSRFGLQRTTAIGFRCGEICRRSRLERRSSLGSAKAARIRSHVHKNSLLEAHRIRKMRFSRRRHSRKSTLIFCRHPYPFSFPPSPSRQFPDRAPSPFFVSFPKALKYNKRRRSVDYVDPNLTFDLASH